MKQINYCRCFIMSELKYIASKNGLKYKTVRFEAGSEGKRAKINQKAATVDFTVYPAKFEPNLKLTNEEIEEISVFTKTMETEFEAAEVKEFILRYREGLRVEIISKATGGCPEIIADLVDSLKRALVPKGTLEASPDHLCFLVEGETEGNYISAYARRLGVLNKISIIKPSGNSPAEMVKEAAKAELITNAVNAEVPGYYIQAMITGKKPDFLNTLDAEEEETGFRTEYEQITGAVVSIFEAWEKENGVESAAEGLHRLIDDLSKNRIEELRVIRENREAENAILSKLLIPPLCGDESRAEETESEGTQHDADGSSTEDKRTE